MHATDTPRRFFRLLLDEFLSVYNRKEVSKSSSFKLQLLYLRSLDVLNPILTAILIDSPCPKTSSITA
jgi:hypothetical protein